MKLKNSDISKILCDEGITKCCIIIGTYINACSIYDALKDIGYNQPIYMIDTKIDTGKCLADIVAKDAIIIKKKINEPQELIDLINNKISQYLKKYIFFTNEKFLDAVKKSIINGDLINTITYTGSEIDNNIIFDRYQFYEFIKTTKNVNVPKTIGSNSNPFEVLGSQFIVRMKRSWRGAERLPRVTIVNGTGELESIERNYEELGFTRDMWCYQELLSVTDKHNISVCGWYDKDFKQYAVTRKILQHPPKTGNGDVIETVGDFPEELLVASEEILKKLKYSGPFELEFVYDNKNNTYKVIELNPRYWMQHGLVNRLTDYSLIRRNIGEISINEIPAKQLSHKYWVNTNQALYRMFKGQFIIAKYLSKGINYPKILDSIKWSIHYMNYKKIIRRDKVENPF